MINNLGLNINIDLGAGASLPVLSFASSAAKAEGNSGSTAFTFTLNLTRNGYIGSVPFVWDVSGTGANPADAQDFVGGIFPTGSDSFGLLETTKTITVNIQGDSTVEPTENFIIGAHASITANASLTLPTASSTGTITNDDTNSVSSPEVPTTEVFTRSAYFGRENADRLLDSTGVGIKLPTNATLLPPAGTDWYSIIWFTMNAQGDGNNNEMLLSLGANQANGGNDKGIWVFPRATATYSWSLGLRGQSGNSADAGQLMTGIGVLLGQTGIKLELSRSYCLILAQTGNVARLRIGEVGANSLVDTELVSTDNFGFNGFYFTAATAVTSITRNNGIATVVRSGSHGLVTGDVVRVESTDGLDIGPKTVASVPNSTTFTYATTAINGTTTGNYSKSRTPGELFRLIGRAENPTTFSGPPVTYSAYPFSGAVGPYSFHWGSVPLDNGTGKIDATWFMDLKNGNKNLASLPGTNRYTHNIGDLTAPATGVITTPPTMFPTEAVIKTAPPVLQTDYLGFDYWPQDWPFATVFGQSYGTIELGFRFTGTARPLMGRVLNSQGNVIVADKQIAVPGTNGRGLILIPQVPEGVGHRLQAWWPDKPAYVQEFGPFDVGPVYGFISQSTLEVLFAAPSLGPVAPISASQGQGQFLWTAGNKTNSGSFPTDSAIGCRPGYYRLRYTGQGTNGTMGISNKLIELRGAARGKKVSVGIVDLCRSGHPADFIVTDRKTYRVSIGNITANNTTSGSWKPLSYSSVSVPIFLQKGATKLYVGGVLVAKTNDAGTWVAESGYTVSGSMAPVSSGAYSVNCSVGGAAEIEATLFYDTQPGTTALPRIDRGDNFTAFGPDNDPTLGSTLRILYGAKRMTAVLYSWANYALSTAGSLNSSQLLEQQSNMINGVRSRYASHPQVYRADTGDLIPWIIMDDPRTCTGEAAEHSVRVAHRLYAGSTANTYYVVGPLSASMDGSISPHADPTLLPGTHLIGETIAHGISKSEGYSPNSSPVTFLQSAVRGPNGAYVDLTFTPHPQGASLVSGKGGTPQGIFYGTTNTNVSQMSMANNNVAITGPNTVRVTPKTGSFPAVSYWNYNAGGPRVGGEAVNVSSYVRSGGTVTITVPSNILYPINVGDVLDFTFGGTDKTDIGERTVVSVISPTQFTIASSGVDATLANVTYARSKAFQDTILDDMLFWNDGGYASRPGTGVSFSTVHVAAS